MFLGVDGGGTKTAYAIVDAEGRLRASHVGTTIAHLADGLDAARARLTEGLEAVLAQADGNVPRRRLCVRRVARLRRRRRHDRRARRAAGCRPGARPLSLRQRHGLQLGGLARLRRRDQRHCRHGVHGLRRVRGPPGALRRLGRADRRRGLGVLDRARRHEPVLAHERRARRTRTAASPGARAFRARERPVPLLAHLRSAGGPPRRIRAVRAARARGRAVRRCRSRRDLRARRARAGRLRRRDAPRARRGEGRRPCRCRTAAACSTTRRRWWTRSAPASRRHQCASSTVPRNSRPRSGAALYAARLAGTPLSDAALGRLQQQLQLPGATR